MKREPKKVDSIKIKWSTLKRAHKKEEREEGREEGKASVRVSCPEDISQERAGEGIMKIPRTLPSDCCTNVFKSLGKRESLLMPEKCEEKQRGKNSGFILKKISWSYIENLASIHL